MKNRYNLILVLLLMIWGCKNNKQNTSEKQTEPITAGNYTAKLGEGALWDYKNSRLLWIDIESGLLNIYNEDEKTNRKIDLGKRIGTVVPKPDGNVVVALEDGIYELNLVNEKLTLMARPEPDSLGNRFNDGKCDPAGRFWAGTMSVTGKKKAGALYMINPDFSFEKKIDSVGTSNGIVWSIDKTKMYYIDTPTKKVVEYQYNNETGEITNPRDAIVIPDSLGYPDGSTLDSEGMLWIAMWGGSAVTRWNPASGELLDKINIPAKNVTSIAFGGKNLDVMYVTTANQGMSEEDKNEYPLAGRLFELKSKVKGIPCSYFGEGN